MSRSRRAFFKQAIAAFGTSQLASTAPQEASRNVPPSPAERAAMEGVATAVLKAHSIPGLSVTIAAHGQLVYEQGFGFADRNNRVKVTPSNLFRIASVSKPITSVTVFDLIERGKLNLGQIVFGPEGVLQNDFGAPPYKPYVEQIRLSHLLTHTCGGWTNDGTDPMFRNPSMNHKQLITWTLRNVPLIHLPGQHYAYSNFGYCIVGRIIEKVTGQSYETHVREAILRRCGVSGMRISGNTQSERALGEVMYYANAGGNPYTMNVRRMDSHGGWLASASDLVRFLIHVDGFPSPPDILQPASIRDMTTSTTANPQYAKGWAINNVPNWWHSGSLPGTTTIMVRTASGFCWAALANSREAGGDTGGALDRMMWEMVGKVKNWNA
jgi:CubicO group peptidase (beta-lactamase class C family)